MACDRYLELLSARLDGALSESEERELEEHLASCPDCRALAGELKQLRAGFSQLEEAATAPEGFAQGVMDRIRAEETKKKVIPLFRRPQFRALAGLAACLVLVVGIYGVSQQQKQASWDMVTRSMNQDVQESLMMDAAQAEDAPMVNAALAGPEEPDAPQASAYTAPGAAPSDAFDGAAEKSISGDAAAAPPPDAIITFECLPEGWEELFPGVASIDAMQAPIEEARTFLRLLEEQGIAYEIELSDAAEQLGFDENSMCQLLLAEK